MVVLAKHRKYGTLPSGELSDISAAIPGPYTVISHEAPIATTDTLLRTRTQFTMSVQVGSGAGAPSERFWPETIVSLVAYWQPSSSTAVGALVGTSEHYLGSQVLVPEIAMSPTAAGEYVVTWRQTEDLVTQTSRHDPAATSGPKVNIGIFVYDTNNALDGTYPSIIITYTVRLFTLWGSIP